MCVSSAVCVQVQEFNRVDLIIKHEAPKGSNSAVMEVRLEVIMTGKKTKTHGAVKLTFHRTHLDSERRDNQVSHRRYFQP